MLVQLELGETRLFTNCFAISLVSAWRFGIKLQIAARFPNRARQMLLACRSDGPCHFLFPVGGPLSLCVECSAGQTIWLADLALLRVTAATMTQLSLRFTPSRALSSSAIQESLLVTDRAWTASAAGKIENILASS